MYNSLMNRKFGIKPTEDLKLNKYTDFKQFNNLTLSNLTVSNTKITEMLNHVCMIKLCGGLGLSMGCDIIGPKSLIKVIDSLNFIDITVNQLIYLNTKYNTHIPLILMCSIKDIQQIEIHIQKYKNVLNIFTILQSYIPMTNAQFNEPISTYAPPGDGELIQLIQSDNELLQKLKKMGTKILFVSNIENVGGYISNTIMYDFYHSNKKFGIEIIDSQSGDETFVVDDYKIKIIPETKTNYKLINNIYLKLDVIINDANKNFIHDMNIYTCNVEQYNAYTLELKLNSLIHAFNKDKIVIYSVPDTRWLNVKDCSNLFLIQSNLYQLCSDYKFIKSFSNHQMPEIIFDSNVKKYVYYQSFIISIPDLRNLKKLTIKNSNTRIINKQLHLSGEVVFC